MAKKMHRLLERQLHHLTGNLLTELAPGLRDRLDPLFEAISQAYDDLDNNRVLLENAMELSSKELIDANREMRLQNSELQAIYQIAILTLGESSIEVVANEILRQIAIVSGYQYLSFEIYNSEARNLKLVGQIGFGENDFLNTETSIDKTPSGMSLKENVDVFESDSLPELLRAKNIWHNTSVRSFLALSLRSQSGSFGAIAMGSAKPIVLDERIRQWLTAVVNQIASAMERKYLQEKMLSQQAAMVTSAKLAELGQIAGGMAHEINTPLSTINMFAGSIKEICERGEVDPDRFSELAEGIEQTVARAAKIIQGIRSYSRDGARDPMQITKVKDLLEETLFICRARLLGANINLTIDCPSHIEIKCRNAQVCQVLLNLINNACDATEKLGQRWIRIEVKETPDTICLSITDSGKGIDKKTQENLFRPFFTTKAIGRGTGLGLSVSRRIIASHQGTLSLNLASPNTSFVIELPKDPVLPAVA